MLSIDGKQMKNIKKQVKRYYKKQLFSIKKQKHIHSEKKNQKGIEFLFCFNQQGKKGRGKNNQLKSFCKVIIKIKKRKKNNNNQYTKHKNQKLKRKKHSSRQMNKKLLVVLFGFLALAAATNQSEEEGSYTIDQAANLLNELLADSQQNLSDLQAAWANKEPLLQGVIAGLQSDLANKQAECADLQHTLDVDTAALEEAESYVAWLQDRIASNHKQIDDLLNRRCQQNGNYIEGLKNDKLALALLQFLEAQIQNKESFSFLQKKNFMKKLTRFLSIYKSGNYQQLALLEKEYVNADDYSVNPDYSVGDRTADEIGSGHIDNDKGDIDVADFQEGERKGWYQIKQELLDLLHNLEQTIEAKIQQAQEDEVNSNSAAADFKSKLEHEIQVYERELAKWQQTVADLTATVAKDNDNENNCHSQEAAIQANLDAAIQDYANEKANFEHKQANLQEEIQIFQEVIAYYDDNVQNAGEDLKERVDDYSDGNFDDASTYENRQVPNIDFIN
ncbi:hypothetical protein ABPG74_004541 [Tetrahymena malaccensis]